MSPSKSTLLVDRPVCRVDVDLASLTHNLSILKRSFADAEAICMVKANAYGHGSVQVSRFLEHSGVKWFGVATVDEGVELREAGITARILIMSGSGAQLSAREILNYELTPLISSIDELDAFAAQGKKSLKIHLDLDTGMSRGGFFSLDGLKNFSRMSSLEIEGVSTHFAMAEELECKYSHLQSSRFIAFLKQIVENGLSPRFVHLDKSASILSQTSQGFRSEIRRLLPKVEFLMRPGLALYGVDPTIPGSHRESLRPALTWKAPIVLRKKLPAGTPVGYDGTYVAPREVEMALIRVGYADGLKRLLSNHGHMVVGGCKAPIIGRISMDLTAIDVSEPFLQGKTEACEVGQYASIIDGEGEYRQSVYDLAKACGTIPYEILTSISARVKRFSK